MSAQQQLLSSYWLSWYPNFHEKLFNSSADMTSDSWYHVAEYRSWLSVSWWYLYPTTENNDNTWRLERSVAWLTKRKAQARMYMQPSTRWWDQTFLLVWWSFPNYWSTNRNYWPWLYVNMTQAAPWSSYLWNWTTTPWAILSSSWWFTWWFVYEIEYDNWSYVVTRYNDTTEVTTSSTFTHRISFSAWAWSTIVLKMRYWFNSENYILTDWIRMWY